MSRYICFLIISLTSSFALAHPTCTGVVTKVIDDGSLRIKYGSYGIHNICAFDNNKKCDRWLSIVLTAQATGKSLSVQYWGEGKTCADVNVSGSWAAGMSAMALHLTN